MRELLQMQWRSPPPQVSEPEATVDYSQLLPNGKEPAPGVIVGGQPTLDQLDEVAALGVKTAINLRTAGESEIGSADLEARGMAYVSIPIAGAEGLNADSAAAFTAALEEAERPVMVYCGSGNRVGGLFALKAYYHDGATVEEALALGKEYGLTRLEPAVREHLDSATRE